MKKANSADIGLEILRHSVAAGIGARLPFVKWDKLGKAWKKNKAGTIAALVKFGILNAAGIYFSPYGWLSGVLLGSIAKRTHDWHHRK